MKTTTRKTTAKKPVPCLQVRAEYGDRNIISFTLPVPKATEGLVELKEAIRQHCPKAIRAEVQAPGGEPEIITLSRKPASILT